MISEGLQEPIYTHPHAFKEEIVLESYCEYE